MGGKGEDKMDSGSLGKLPEFHEREFQGRW